MTQQISKAKTAPQTPQVKVWRMQTETKDATWDELIASPRQVAGSPPPSGRFYCENCIDDEAELRWLHQTRSGKPCDPWCEECYSPPQTGGCGDPVMDGPCFDDLPIAQKGASK